MVFVFTVSGSVYRAVSFVDGGWEVVLGQDDVDQQLYLDWLPNEAVEAVELRSES